jgi:hypothetical protein
VAADRATRPGWAGQRAGHRTQPGLRARLGAPPAGGHGRRRTDHRAADRRRHWHRSDRHRTVRQRLWGERIKGRQLKRKRIGQGHAPPWCTPRSGRPRPIWPSCWPPWCARSGCPPLATERATENA